MLSDLSVGHANTWSFLDRRIADAIYIGNIKHEVEKGVITLGNGMLSLANLGAFGLFSKTKTPPETKQ